MLRELIRGRQKIGYPHAIRHRPGMPADPSGNPLTHVACPGCGTVNHIDEQVYRIRTYLRCAGADCGATIPYSRYAQAYR